MNKYEKHFPDLENLSPEPSGSGWDLALWQKIDASEPQKPTAPLWNSYSLVLVTLLVLNVLAFSYQKNSEDPSEKREDLEILASGILISTSSSPF